MIRRVALLIAAATFAACGSSAKKSVVETEETTTSSVVSTTIPPASTTVVVVRAKPQCVAPTLDSYNYTKDPNGVGSQQSELSGDIQKVTEYGEQHADEFTSVRFENHPRVSIVATFTGHLEQHRFALRRVLAHPDAVDVEQGVQSERDVQAMQRVIGDRAQQLMRTSGGRPSGVVDINLNPTAEGRRLAAEFERTYGDRICISLALHPYPRGAWPDADQCLVKEVPSGVVADVTVDLRLDTTRVARGDVVRGTAHVTNNGSRPLTYQGGTDIEGFVVALGSSAPIGGQVGVFHNLAGRTYTAEPGGSVDVPVVVGTDDCRKDADYALPPGRYGVITYVKPFGRSNEVPLEIVE